MWTSCAAVCCSPREARAVLLACLSVGSVDGVAGFPKVAERKASELAAALSAVRSFVYVLFLMLSFLMVCTRQVSGAEPVLFDMSPCAYEMKRTQGDKIKIADLTEFLHEQVLSRPFRYRLINFTDLFCVMSLGATASKDHTKAARDGCCALSMQRQEDGIRKALDRHRRRCVPHLTNFRTELTICHFCCGHSLRGVCCLSACLVLRYGGRSRVALSGAAGRRAALVAQ